MSSSDIAISVQNLSKCFQVYANPRDRLKQFILPRISRVFGRVPKQYYSEFWALKDISFEIKKGETVGIIGRNGSGKSTLLQIICGTLTPTHGQVQTQGRIAALLELGSGFNPEFTGRENVYMNAAVLGLTKEETDNRFDDITAFADIGQFVDRPVKTYSSGMMMRLAFSVAINVEPDILIVDEALSVGDELFQRKCFARIEAIRAKGSTILFVSHSGGQIIELCDKAVLIDSGVKLMIGPPKPVVGIYQKLLYAPADKLASMRDAIFQSNQDADILEKLDEEKLTNNTLGIHHQDIKESFDPNLKPDSTIVYESHGAHIQTPIVTTLEGNQVNNLVQGRSYRYEYQVSFNKAASNIRFGMLIKTTSGLELGGAVTANFLKDSLPYAKAGSTYKISFQFNCVLNNGVYFLNTGVIGEVGGDETYLHRVTDAAMFRVLPSTESVATGTVDFSCIPNIEHLLN